jgi:hypothetical protein
MVKINGECEVALKEILKSILDKKIIVNITYISFPRLKEIVK